jgi:hypothetical protein
MATPSHVDLSVLWVPIMPETSKVGPAMEQAGKDGKTRFDKSVKDIGKTISDDMTKVSTKTKDVFSGMGKNITDVLKKSGEDGSKAISDSLSNIKGADKAADSLRKVDDSAKGATGSLRNLGAAFAALKPESLEDAKKSLGSIDDNAKKVGVDVSEWTGPLAEAVDKFGGIKDDVKTFADDLKDMPGVIGKIGEALGAIAPQIAAFAAIGQNMDKVQEFFHNQGFQGANPPGQKGGSDWGWDWMHPWDIPGKSNQWWPFKHDWDANHPKPPPPPMPNPFTPGSPLNSMLLPGGPADSTPNAGSKWANSPWFPGNPNPPPSDTPSESGGPSSSGSGSGSSGRSGGGSGGSPRTPSVGSRSDLHAAGSRIANLYAFAQSLVGTPYSTALRNDCSGMVSELASVALGLPPPPAGERFSTANEGDWLMSHGFQEGMGPEGSLRIGWHNGGPGGGHTAATLPGGEHAEQGGSHNSFVVGPQAAGAEDPQFEHHAYLPMDGNGGPMGSKSDPLYVSSADGTGGGTTSAESQGQQLGQGLVNGVLQMFGIDGSVFKGFGSGKGLLDFGAVKLGGGILNWGLHMAQAKNAQMQGGGGAAGSPVGDASGPGIAIPGLGMLPMHLPRTPGAAVSAGAVPTPDGQPAGSPSMGPGDTIHVHGDVNPVTVNQSGVKDGPGAWQQYNIGTQANRYRAQMASLPKVAMA